jgi:hypothetical protein
MRKYKTSGFKRIILILSCLQVSFLPCSVDVRAGNMGIFEKAQSRTVNLEATYLLHVLKLVQWSEKDLPAEDKPVKSLIVGQDKTSFLDRFAFLVSESKTRISGRRITVHGVEGMKDALLLAQNNKDVVLIVALDSVAEQWNKTMYPKRSGLLFYGQSEKFKQSGMALFSQISNNRVKISVNLTKTKAVGLTVSPKLLIRNRIFYIDKKRNRTLPERSFPSSRNRDYSEVQTIPILQSSRKRSFGFFRLPNRLSARSKNRAFSS